jgi:hypothetical protein
MAAHDPVERVLSIRGMRIYFLDWQNDQPTHPSGLPSIRSSCSKDRLSSADLTMIRVRPLCLCMSIAWAKNRERAAASRTVALIDHLTKTRRLSVDIGQFGGRRHDCWVQAISRRLPSVMRRSLRQVLRPCGVLRARRHSTPAAGTSRKAARELRCYANPIARRTRQAHPIASNFIHACRTISFGSCVNDAYRARMNDLSPRARMNDLSRREPG